jgi:ribosomal protein L16/L10AE
MSLLINLKYKKFHKNPIKGIENKINLTQLTKGSIGIKVLENARISLSQIEAIKFLLIKNLKNFERY